MSFVAGTTPYPWPWNGQLRPERLALVITGWDGHWAGATGPLDAAGTGGKLVSTIAALAEAVSRAGGRVITVAHTAPARWPEPVDEAPARWPEPSLVATRIMAAGIDGFYGSPLDHLLRQGGVELVLLAGLGLETTVHSTMRTANDAGLECLCVIDACAPLDAALTGRAVSMIEMSGGIFGAVGASADVVAALSQQFQPTPTTESKP